ncbi:protein PROCA1 [Pelodiscus sinensis]|uniref:protein PROCA1 n=1 Tax=Pelodiscus sinensis TaxID=13735 RepID=UPI003F6CF81E
MRGAAAPLPSGGGSGRREPGPPRSACGSPGSGGRQPPGATWAPEPAGGAARRRAKRGFTYPGTLWCGAGTNAESYEQLGEHRETDRCCREHDHCQHVIHPFTSRYGYRNLRWHTVSHCACDRRLQGCLRQVNDTASRVVGQAFFNVIQVPCFEFAYQEQCAEPYLYLWCRKYHTVPIAVAREPVLYEFGGERIDAAAVGRPAALPSTPLPPSRAPARTGTQGLGSFGTSLAPGPKPGSRQQGQGKKRGGKSKKGKRLKKGPSTAGVLGLPTPAAEAASLSSKHLGGAEAGRELLDTGGRENAFNAILNDAPAAAALAPRGPEQAPGTAQPQGKARTPPRPPGASRRRQRERSGRKGRSQRAGPLPKLL